MLLAGTFVSCANDAPRWQRNHDWVTPPKVMSATDSDGEAGSSQAAFNLNAWVNSHRTPNRCVSAAKQDIKVEPARALKLLIACSTREDFDVLIPLLRRPWVDVLRKSGPAGYAVLLRSIARRGEFEADFGSLQAAGFPVGGLGVKEARPGQLTPIVGVVMKSKGVVKVEELEREKRKYGRKPGKWKETTYRVDRRTGFKQVIKTRFFTVERSQTPGGFVPSGTVVRFPRPPKCMGPTSDAKVMLVRVGRQVDTDGPEEFEASSVACHSMGK